MPTISAGTRRSNRTSKNSASYAGFETETISYLKAINGNTQFAIAINDFVRGCKSDGVWDLLDWIWPLAGMTLQNSLTPLKARGSYLAPCRNFNFVPSDYSETAGLTGNGTTKWLQAAAVWDNYPTGNVHFSAYSCTVPDTPVNTVTLGGGSTQRRVEPSYGTLNGGFPSIGAVVAGVQVFIKPMPDQYASGFQNCTDYIGLWSGIEAGPTGYMAFRGISSLNSAITPGVTVTGNIGLLAQAPATGTTPTSWAACTVGFACVGPAISIAQLSLLNARVETLMVAMGRRKYPSLTAPVDGIVTLGQSLMLGTDGTAVRNLTQAYGNLSISPSANGALLNTELTTKLLPSPCNQVVPLVEFLQSSSSATANNLRTAGWPNPLLTAGAPIGSSAYSILAPGTTPYLNTLLRHKVANYYISTLAGQQYRIKALVCVHGETDDNTPNTSYDTNLATWQSSYQTDLQAITGQAQAIPMFISQMNSWCGYKPRETPVVAPLQYNAWANNPTSILLVGPKYMMTHNATDKVHLNDGNQYCWLGSYIAKAMYGYFVLGSWAPLAPLSVTRAGASIVVVFNKGGLVFDTTLVTDPSGTYPSRKFGTAAGSATDTTVTNFKGFEFVDDNTTTPSANITGASISTTTLTNDTVTLTLSGTPTGTNKRLRYAYSMTLGNVPGPTTGARGNLRDSDTSFDSSVTALYGSLLFTTYNWCPTFDLSAA